MSICTARFRETTTPVMQGKVATLIECDGIISYVYIGFALSLQALYAKITTVKICVCQSYDQNTVGSICFWARRHAVSSRRL